jgi:hypothetical protein
MSDNGFATNSDIQHAIVSWLKALGTFFHNGIGVFVSWWYKCFKSLVTMWKSDVYQSLLISHICIYVRIKVLHIGSLVTLFFETPLYIIFSEWHLGK